jgi:hypothetical protein
MKSQDSLVEPLYGNNNRSLSAHALRFQHTRLAHVSRLSEKSSVKFSMIGCLHSDGQGRLKESEEVYQQASKGKENTLSPEHTSTVDTVNNLSVLYGDQGKLKEARD